MRCILTVGLGDIESIHFWKILSQSIVENLEFNRPRSDSPEVWSITVVVKINIGGAVVANIVDIYQNRISWIKKQVLAIKAIESFGNDRRENSKKRKQNRTKAREKATIMHWHSFVHQMEEKLYDFVRYGNQCIKMRRNENGIKEKYRSKSIGI